MKNLVLIIIASLSFGSLYGQNALSFSEAEEQGIIRKTLDSLYCNAMDDGSGNFVFENKEEVMEAWTKMLTDISSFLFRKAEIKNIEVKLFQRVYFNKEGKIDYLLYNIRNKDDVTEEQLQQVIDVLNEFVKDYQFSLSADRDFVQCGTAIFSK